MNGPVLLVVLTMALQAAPAPPQNSGHYVYPPRDFKYYIAQMSFFGATTADFLITMTMPDDVEEGNPVLGQSKARQVAVMAGTGVLVMYLALRLEHRGHRKAAHAVLWFGTAVHGGAAVANLVRR